MSDTKLFSVGVDSLLKDVRPYGHGQKASVFPRGLDETKTRRNAGENLHQWFVRVVDQFCGSDPKKASVEDNIAVFLNLSWNRKRLVYAKVQTVIAACELDEYYLEPAAEAQYLRLDFDYKTLGDPFSHPLAHIHVGGDLSPRFALEGGISGNIVVDYLESLYRNFVPAKWVKWAEREWEQEFTATAQAGDMNYFPLIVDAFASSQFQILRDNAALLTRIKQTLRKRKDSSFDGHMEGAEREILEYPLAR